MGIAGYLSVCVQLIICWFPLSFTTCFGLNGDLQVSKILHIFIFETKQNNKNNDGKQHRNKTQMDNMQSVTTRKKAANQKEQRSRILGHMKINI
jgi:hypothetical protein